MIHCIAKVHAGGGEKYLRDAVLLLLKMKEGPCWKGYEGLPESERSCPWGRQPETLHCTVLGLGANEVVPSSEAELEVVAVCVRENSQSWVGSQLSH